MRETQLVMFQLLLFIAYRLANKSDRDALKRFVDYYEKQVQEVDK